MKKAVFFDRDGTLLTLYEGTGYLTSTKGMRLMPGAAAAIAACNMAGFLVLLHTNQANIARGRLTEKDLHTIHTTIEKRLQKAGAHIDGIYYCPHHPAGTVERYRLVCECRKPEAGMLTTAIKEFGIDASKSFLVGDSRKDILAGRRAGLNTLLVMTGNAGKEEGAPSIEPDFFVANISEAVRHILKK